MANRVVSKTDFFSSGPADDVAYVNIRDNDEFNFEIRNAIELMWQEYSELCPDSDFLTQSRADLNAMLWQMQFTILLKRKGFTIKKTKAHGPDICFIENEQKHWIETISAHRGTGIDAVPLYTDGFAHPVPEEQIILRIRAAIEAKKIQHQGWLQKGIVQHHEPFIIAINAGKLGSADLSPVITFAEKAVFPIGKMGWSVKLGSNDTSETIYTFRDKITKRSGSDVKTDLFLNEEYACISGIFYSPHHFSNSFNRNAFDFTFIHNPNANCPITLETFRFGHERWVANGELRDKDWTEIVS